MLHFILPHIAVVSRGAGRHFGPRPHLLINYSAGGSKLMIFAVFSLLLISSAVHCRVDWFHVDKSRNIKGCDKWHSEKKGQIQLARIFTNWQTRWELCIIHQMVTLDDFWNTHSRLIILIAMKFTLFCQTTVHRWYFLPLGIYGWKVAISRKRMILQTRHLRP